MLMGTAGSVQTQRPRPRKCIQVEDDIAKHGQQFFIPSNKLVNTEIRHPQVNLDQLLLKHDPKLVSYIGPKLKKNPCLQDPWVNLKLFTPPNIGGSHPKHKLNKFNGKLSNHWDDMENDSRTRLPMFGYSTAVRHQTN